ncbi:MAG TPA: VOC family protein [Mucilaginibacter sp.]|nr:VOC family protein [Mucilaginibacter sp.]
MKIIVTSVLVDDQAKALKFYTDILGFIKKEDIDMGEARWLTVVSSDAENGVELLLEPNWNAAIQINGEPAAKAFQKILFDAGIPATAFGIEDVQKEYERLEGLGVAFKTKPTKMGPVIIAKFDDTCGNLIQMVQK